MEKTDANNNNNIRSPPPGEEDLCSGTVSLPGKLAACLDEGTTTEQTDFRILLSLFGLMMVCTG